MEPSNKKTAPSQPAGKKRNTVKQVEFAIGVTALGSAMTLRASKKHDLEAISMGVKATSHGTGRIVVIPYSNVKCFELFAEEECE